MKFLSQITINMKMIINDYENKLKQEVAHDLRCLFLHRWKVTEMGTMGKNDSNGSVQNDNHNHSYVFQYPLQYSHSLEYLLHHFFLEICFSLFTHKNHILINFFPLNRFHFKSVSNAIGIYQKFWKLIACRINPNKVYSSYPRLLVYNV